jgi:hypothetical protein
MLIKGLLLGAVLVLVPNKNVGRPHIVATMPPYHIVENPTMDKVKVEFYCGVDYDFIVMEMYPRTKVTYEFRNVGKQPLECVLDNWHKL